MASIRPCFGALRVEERVRGEGKERKGKERKGKVVGGLVLASFFHILVVLDLDLGSMRVLYNE